METAPRDGVHRRRALAFLLIVVALGAATTIGTAWFLAALVHPEGCTNRISSWTTSRRAALGERFVYEHAGPGRRAYVLTPRQWTADADDALRIPSWARLELEERGSECLDDARGWPWLALHCRWREVDLYASFLLPAAHVQGGVVIRPFVAEGMLVPAPVPAGRRSVFDIGPMDWHDRARALPLLPIWPGFLADTGLAALAWFVLLVGVRAPAIARRFLRRVRGACRRCGYARRGIESPVCSECGWNHGRALPVIGPGTLRVATAALVLLVTALGFGAAALIVDAPPGALHEAAATGDVDRLAALLARGASADQPLASYDHTLVEYDIGTLPLDWAAHFGRAESIEILLAHGASARRPWWDPLLADAVRSGNVESVRLLVEAGAVVDHAWSASALGEALLQPDPEIVEVLLARLTTDPEQRARALEDAVERARIAGHEQHLPVLFAAGADPVATLDSAVEGRNVDTVEALLHLGVRPGEAPGSVWSAIRARRTDVAAALIEHGAAPDVEPSSLHAARRLHLAVKHGDLECLRQLIDAGADPHAVDENGRTILFHLPWSTGADPDWSAPDLSLIEFVLGLGLDLDRRDRHGESALIQAVRLSRVRAVRTLLEAGADPRVENASGIDALGVARWVLDGPIVRGPRSWRVEILWLVEAELNRRTARDSDRAPVERVESPGG